MLIKYWENNFYIYQNKQLSLMQHEPSLKHLNPQCKAVKDSVFQYDVRREKSLPLQIFLICISVDPSKEKHLQRLHQVVIPVTDSSYDWNIFY